MKNVTAAFFLAGMMLAAPLLASAQVNTSASIQKSFLAELQSLATQLATLTATINAMIVASGGAVATTSVSVSTTSQQVLAPAVYSAPAAPATIPADLSTGDLISLLKQLITPSSYATSTTSYASSSVSKQTAAQPTYAGTPAIQMDPSCVSGLFAIGNQCGGLFFCGPDAADGYWSSTSCIASR